MLTFHLDGNCGRGLAVRNAMNFFINLFNEFLKNISRCNLVPQENQKLDTLSKRTKSVAKFFDIDHSKRINISYLKTYQDTITYNFFTLGLCIYLHGPPSLCMDMGMHLRD